MTAACAVRRQAPVLPVLPRIDCQPTDWPAQRLALLVVKLRHVDSSASMLSRILSARSASHPVTAPAGLLPCTAGAHRARLLEATLPRRAGAQGMVLQTVMGKAGLCRAPIRTGGDEGVCMPRVAIVTGGASGIGRALGAALVRRGDEVVLADVDGAAAGEVAEQLTAVGPGKASAATVDVREAAAVAELVTDTVDGRGQVDLMFNNAGVGIGGPVEEWPWRTGTGPSTSTCAGWCTGCMPLTR